MPFADFECAHQSWNCPSWWKRTFGWRKTSCKIRFASRMQAICVSFRCVRRAFRTWKPAFAGAASSWHCGYCSAGRFFAFQPFADGFSPEQYGWNPASGTEYIFANSWSAYTFAFRCKNYFRHGGRSYRLCNWIRAFCSVRYWWGRRKYVCAKRRYAGKRTAAARLKARSFEHKRRNKHYSYAGTFPYGTYSACFVHGCYGLQYGYGIWSYEKIREPRIW